MQFDYNERNPKKKKKKKKKIESRSFMKFFAVDLSFNNRAEIIYDKVQMHEHLLSCLESGQLHPF